LELSIGAAGQKTIEWWGYRANKEVWRYLQLFWYNAPMWRTDSQMGTGQQQRPH